MEEVFTVEVIDECSPTNLSIGQISDQIIEIGNDQSTLSLELNQEPCFFAVSYSAQQRSDTGTFTDPLPYFIDIDSNSNELIINPTSLEDIAVYVIRI